jgi:hypothetical protein
MTESNMEELKIKRKQYLKIYDVIQKEKDFFNKIITNYQEKFSGIYDRPHSSEQNDSNIETYFKDELETFERRYAKYYVELGKQELDITRKIMDLNSELGLDNYDLDSENE